MVSLLVVVAIATFCAIASPVAEKAPNVAICVGSWYACRQYAYADCSVAGNWLSSVSRLDPSRAKAFSCVDVVWDGAALLVVVVKKAGAEILVDRADESCLGVDCELKFGANALAGWDSCVPNNTKTAMNDAMVESLVLVEAEVVMATVVLDVYVVSRCGGCVCLETAKCFLHCQGNKVMVKLAFSRGATARAKRW